MRVAILLVLLVLLSLASRAAAQTRADSLPIGAAVRVHGITATSVGDRSYYLEGRVAGTDARHLLVAQDSGARVDTLPFFAMSTLDVSQGHVGRGQLIGTAALVGAGFGAAAYVVVRVLETADGRETWHNFERPALISIPLLGSVGAVIGALSGTEKWIAVRIPGAYVLPRR